jgi:hypothetical protein
MPYLFVIHRGLWDTSSFFLSYWIMTPNAKPVLAFIAKSIAFSFIFWTVWYSLQRYTAPSSNAAQSAAYDEQMARVNRQLDAVDAQQKRMDAYLHAQEGNTARFDKVLQAWERQTGLRK